MADGARTAGLTPGSDEPEVSVRAVWGVFHGVGSREGLGVRKERVASEICLHLGVIRTLHGVAWARNVTM
jgi:hypothetical protein